MIALDKVQNANKERLASIIQIIQKNNPTLIDSAYDSDDDVYYSKYQQKEKVDFQFEENWFTGYIDVLTDEMVHCIADSQPATGKRIQVWIEMESDKIAPPHTQTLNEKRILHQYYVNMLRTNQQKIGQ